MKKTALSMVLACSLFGNTDQLCVEYSGWNLMGATKTLDAGIDFNDSSKVNIVWAFDNNTKSWMGYSPDSGIMGKISSTNGISTLGQIQAGVGYWINVKDAGCLNSDGNDSTDEGWNIQTTSTTTNLTFSNLTVAYNLEEGDNNWYSVVTKNGNTLSVANWEYENDTWVNDDNFNITININSTNPKLATISSEDGFGADVTLGTTLQITHVDDTPYSDLFMTPLTLVVTSVGEPWEDIWNFTPTYYDGSQQVNVTNNTQLLSMFLNGSWFSDEYMLSGSGTSGSVVKANITCGEYCTATPTSEVVGTWTFDSSTGINATITNHEEVTLSIVSCDTSISSSGYCVKNVGNDLVGAVWEEMYITGSDATNTSIEGFLQGSN